MIEEPWVILLFGFWLAIGAGLGLLAWALVTLIVLVVWGSWISYSKMRRAADRVYEDVKKNVGRGHE